MSDNNLPDHISQEMVDRAMGEEPERAAREMTLAEWVAKLPATHRATRDYDRLIDEVRQIAQVPTMLAALEAARHALLSYQHGNHAPDLAEQTADFVTKVIDRAKK